MKINKNIIIITAVWIALITLSFIWNYTNARMEQERIAFQAAKSFFDQVVITREWNALHGGVYVPITKETQPNPYLEDLFRDIQVNDSLKLTKVNPAFMTRQISEIAAQQQGIQFHITSLRPIRPQNKATAREQKALEKFEAGITEVGQLIKSGSKKSFFYMAPLITKKACLKCHAKQGYKEGDIRGGISITLPFVLAIPLIPLLLGHIGIGAIVIFGIISFGVKLDTAYEKIKMQAVIDSLTGIPNRRSFSENIVREFQRSRRDKYPISLIMCDIDHFKAYNDTYGHISGDLCLEKVAQTIKNSIKRPGDFCARYGGEEFVVILPNTSLDGAVHVAEIIRSNVFEMNIVHEKSFPAQVVSLSLGVATSEHRIMDSHEELIEHADKTLYRSKEKGRNRIEFFSKSQ